MTWVANWETTHDKRSPSSFTSLTLYVCSTSLRLVKFFMNWVRLLEIERGFPVQPELLPDKLWLVSRYDEWRVYAVRSSSDTRTQRWQEMPTKYLSFSQTSCECVFVFVFIGLIVYRCCLGDSRWLRRSPLVCRLLGGMQATMLKGRGQPQPLCLCVHWHL